MTISGVDPQRIIARAKHVDTDHSVAYLEIPNGNVIRHQMYDDVELKPSPQTTPAHHLPTPPATSTTQPVEHKTTMTKYRR